MIKDIVKKLLEEKKITPLEKAELLLFFELAEQNNNSIRVISNPQTFGGGTLVVEDLTSQITGSNTHFTLGQVTTGMAYVICNLPQQPSSYIMDDDMRGFTFTFTPTTRDKVVAGYFV